MTTALEQSIADLCEQHNLLSLGITYFHSEPTFYGVSLQWARYGAREGVGSNADTIAQALGNAIAEMQAKRAMAEPVALADEPLPEIV